MKGTPRPSTAKSVPSTAGGRCVKTSNKKGPSTPTEFSSTPVNKEWVTSIAEDVENLLHEETNQSSKANYWMLQQINSELKLLSNFINQNETQSARENVLNSTRKSSAITKSKKSNVQQNAKSKSIVQNKPSVRVPKLRVNSEIPTQPKMQQTSDSNNVQCPGKSKLAIHSCFNINIESTLQSDTKIVSESNTIEQLKSFWNDRMNNYGQPMCSKDKTIDFDNTLEIRKRMHEELVAITSKQKLPDMKLVCDYVSGGYGFNDESESETSIQTITSGCPLPVRRTNKTVNTTTGIIKTSELNSSQETKSFLSIQCIIESLRKMISVLKLVSVDSQSIPIYSQHVHISSEMKQTIIDLVKLVNTEYPGLCDTTLQDDHSVKADKPESTLFKSGLVTDVSGDKNLADTVANFTQSMKITIDIVGDCKNNISNFVRLDDDTLGRNNVGKGIGITVKIRSDDSLGEIKHAAENEEPSGAVDETGLVMESNNLKLNQFEVVNTSRSEILIALDEENDVKEEDNMFILEDAFNKDTNTFFGGGDCSLDDVDSLPSSLKVNFSTSAQYVPESDFDMFSDTSCSEEIAKAVKSASMNDIKRNISGVSIFQELKALDVKTTIIDNGTGLYEELKMMENCSEEDLITQVKERSKDELNELVSKSTITDGEEFDEILNNVILESATGTMKKSSEFKARDEMDKSEVEQDLIEPVTNRVTRISTSNIQLYQAPFNNSWDIPVGLFFIKCVQESLLAGPNEGSILELIRRKTMNNDFKSISENDVLLFILCNLAQQNLQRKSSVENCKCFGELKQICLNHIKTTTNCVVDFVKSSSWDDVAALILDRRILSDIFVDYRSLTTSKIASFIYHLAIGLSLFFILEEEVFGLFGNKKILYPF